MAEYIDRENLKERLEDFSKWCRDGRKQGVDFVLDCPLPDIPTEDVVSVVRCKNCKHRYVPTRCALWYGTVNDTEYFVERGDDFYCSYGERKE